MYDIFSIQVYITFLSIQVHIIIHNVLLCFLGRIFQFKVLVNFGSQLLFFSISVKHSCKMSTLLCVSEGRGWWVVVVGGCVVVSSCTTGPLGLWSRPRKRGHFSPHPVLNEKREGAGGHPCRLDISLRSCCGRRGTIAFFTSQYVLVFKKEKNSNKIQHSVEREAAPTGEDSSFFFT